MNVLALLMLVSAGLSGMIASHKERQPVLWLAAGLVTGPIAVAILLLLPSRGVKATRPSIIRSRSIVDEINGLEEMRQRGLISNDEFQQGKVQVLAWPLASDIPAGLTPQRVWADGRRVWASYQPATRSALIDLAHRHELDLRWRDDVPLEMVATFPVQPGLSFELSLGLEKGSICCWGEGWDLGEADCFRPDQGLPSDLARGLDALIEGRGRLVIRRALWSSPPFCVSLQTPADCGYRTVQRQCGLPASLIWRTCIVTNTSARPQ